eukprot:15474561-Alexandrium_andersonii.AAC.1
MHIAVHHEEGRLVVQLRAQAMAVTSAVVGSAGLSYIRCSPVLRRGQPLFERPDAARAPRAKAERDDEAGWQQHARRCDWLR